MFLCLSGLASPDSRWEAVKPTDLWDKNEQAFRAVPCETRTGCSAAWDTLENPASFLWVTALRAEQATNLGKHFSVKTPQPNVLAKENRYSITRLYFITAVQYFTGHFDKDALGELHFFSLHKNSTKHILNLSKNPEGTVFIEGVI